MKLDSKKILALVDAYNSLTPIGQALEGFSIIQKLDNLIPQGHELRATILEWLQ